MVIRLGMRSESVQMEVSGRCGKIWLNRPETRNALTVGMFDQLDVAVKRLAAESEVVSVVLAGRGQAFCSGFDLGAVVMAPELMEVFLTRLSTTCRAIRRLPQIVVAAVEGPALAGGCALVAACDFVVVSQNAQLGYPVHRIGVSPAVTIPLLRNHVAGGQMRAMLLSGRVVDGADARRIGLASDVVEAGKAEDRALEICNCLEQKGPGALRETKAWLNQLDGSTVEADFDSALAASVDVARSKQARESLKAFWESRHSQSSGGTNR